MGAADSLDACNGSQQDTNWENSRITYQLLKLEEECRWFRSGRQESPRAKRPWQGQLESEDDDISWRGALYRKSRRVFRGYSMVLSWLVYNRVDIMQITVQA